MLRQIFFKDKYSTGPDWNAPLLVWTYREAIYTVKEH